MFPRKLQNKESKKSRVSRIVRSKRAKEWASQCVEEA